MPKKPDVLQASRDEAGRPVGRPRRALRLSHTIWGNDCYRLYHRSEAYKDGKDNAVQIVRDEFSGWIRTYPRIPLRDTDTVSRNLLLFLGPTYDQTTVMCKSDQAVEILAACKRLGFVHQGTLESRFPHNSQLERDFRTIEEARATHLRAGFEVVPDLWPLSVDCVATMLSAQHIAAGKDQKRHYLAVGTEFTGRKLLFGQLVHYRVDPTLRDKIAPSTSPGMFAGFRYDSGPKSFKGVLLVLDYEKVKNRTPGYAIPTAVPTEEVLG